MISRRQRAFDPEGKSSVYPCLRDLHHQGFVNRADPESDLWTSSEMGMKRLRPVWVLKSPLPVCLPRAGIPLEDMTAYELMCRLRDAGWE